MAKETECNGHSGSIPNANCSNQPKYPRQFIEYIEVVNNSGEDLRDGQLVEGPIIKYEGENILVKNVKINTYENKQNTKDN